MKLHVKLRLWMRPPKLKLCGSLGLFNSCLQYNILIGSKLVSALCVIVQLRDSARALLVIRFLTRRFSVSASDLDMFCAINACSSIQMYCKNIIYI